MRKRPQAFPVGLYGMLLFALCWLTLPTVFAPVERWLVGATCVLPRLLARFVGTPAMAASPGLRSQRQLLARQLELRTAAHDRPAAGTLLPIGFESWSCAVLSSKNRGGGGQWSELRLDHSYAELAGCSALVTKGDALLGFLQRPGFGEAVLDKASDPARVLLLNHPAAPPLFAGMTLSDGAQLRFVVRAAAVVDPAPLRVDLWDDPYRAARLKTDGHEVRTLARTDADDGIPAGLLLGYTRIWGYRATAEDESLTIGVYVKPPIDPGALSHVVVWHRVGDLSAVDERNEVLPALRSRHAINGVVHDLPGAAHGRHLLIAAQSVPSGAAVVQDGLFLGTAHGLSFGSGLVTSFALSRQRWNLILLPDDPEAAPVELEGQVIYSDRDLAWLRWRGAEVSDRALPTGYLFTGSNGLYCPAGLYIGRARPDPKERDLMAVSTPSEPGPHPVEILVGEGGS